MLTQDRLKEVPHYDPETGIFRWMVAPNGRIHVGMEAGSPHDGYVSIKIDRVLYKAHRLAWLYMTGSWPAADVDHQDRDKANNRWPNLREATRSQNCANRIARVDNSAGAKGVSFHKASQKYRAAIMVDGVDIWLGVRSTIEEAAALYDAASKKYFGEFARSV